MQPKILVGKKLSDDFGPWMCFLVSVSFHCEIPSLCRD